MERNYRTIIEHHLQNMNAEVAMTAFSTMQPGVRVSGLKPDFFRLILVSGGHGWLELGGKYVESKPGQLHLVPAGSEQSYGVIGDRPLELYWCHFRANLGDIELFDLLHLPTMVQTDDIDEVRGLFGKMVEAFNGHSITRGLRVKAVLWEMLAVYLDKCDIEEESLENMEMFVKLSAVLNYIDTHLDRNILLEDLARVAYLHPNYFIGLFKNIIGVSPIQYVNNRRLETAKKLLAETNRSVAEVASAVGMQNHYLSRLFKQHTGISPKRYRQLYTRTDGKAVYSLPDPDGIAKAVCSGNEGGADGEA